MRFILYLIVAIITICCANENPHEVKKIKAAVTDANVDRFEMRVNRIVALETSDTSLIGTVSKLMYHRGNFYAFDMMDLRSVSCFSDSGKFRYALRNGIGRGEVRNVEDFTLFNNSLLIKDAYNVKDFNATTGEYQDGIHPNQYFFNRFAYSEAGKFITFGYSPAFSEMTKTEFTMEELATKIKLYKIYDTNFDQEIKLLADGNVKYSNYLPFTPIVRFEDHFLCLYPPHPMVYELSADNEFVPKYEIDFGSLSFSHEEIEEGLKFYVSKIREGQRAGFIDDINETTDLITFSFTKDIGFKSYNIYSKESGECVLFDALTKANGLPTLSILTTFGNELVCLLNPSTLTKDQLNAANSKFNLSPNIDSFSNPVIFFLSING
jgi:hypothetical protein